MVFSTYLKCRHKVVILKSMCKYDLSGQFYLSKAHRYAVVFHGSEVLAAPYMLICDYHRNIEKSLELQHMRTCYE
jgi:hypothetical protein